MSEKLHIAHGPANNPERLANEDYRAVSVERIGPTHYRATNKDGATLDFGLGEGMLNPVELLLAAIAGCSAVDVDMVTTRKIEPEIFKVLSSGIKQHEDGAVRLDDIEVDFDVAFDSSEEGVKAASKVDRMIARSAEKDCTVSRTVEHATNVTFRNING